MGLNKCRGIVHAMVERIIKLLFAGRGLPGGKLLSFASPKESNQRKGDPAIPEFPKPESTGRAAQKLGSLVDI